MSPDHGPPSIPGTKSAIRFSDNNKVIITWVGNMDLFKKIRSLKTLLIDDNLTIRDAFQLAFDKMECFLKTVESAEEGLAALENEMFDIIICDFRLPGLNGLEFFEQAIVTHPHAVRVLISGYGNEMLVQEAFEIGVHAFLAKPFTLTDLLEELTVQIEKSKGRTIRAPDSPETKAKPKPEEKSESPKVIGSQPG